MGYDIPSDHHGSLPKSDPNKPDYMGRTGKFITVSGLTDSADQFIERWNQLAREVQANAAAHGFWDGERNKAELICLMHSELSEALEGLRHGNPPDTHCPEFTSLEVELADVVIRIMDFAHGFDLNVAGAMIAKHTYNKSRPMKHGKKF